MRRYGFEPPWSGEDSRYGWWKNVGELWDGGFAWELRPPLRITELLTRMLQDIYMPGVYTQLTAKSLILEELGGLD